MIPTKKLTFNPEIGLDSILMLVCLIGTVIFYTASYSGEAKVLQQNVNRHEQMLQQHEQQLKTLANINAKLTTMIEVEKTRLDSHILNTKP